MSYKLMIKAHNNTGLKYLCITCRDDWEKYTGSGRHWKSHLKKHGEDFRTTLIYECEDYDEFVFVCKLVSELLEIPHNKEYANLVPETGYNNNDGIPNVVLFWRYASVDIKNDIINRRNESIRNNHWTKGESKDFIASKISIKSLERWENIGIDERRSLVAPMRAGVEQFFSNKNSSEYLEWKSKISNTLKTRYENIPFDVLSKRNRESRLNLSSDKRKQRKEKIQAVYNTGKHQHLFDRYSEERKSKSNPAAILISWYGETLTKKEIKTLYRISDKKIEELLKNDDNIFLIKPRKESTYSVTTCPFCSATTNKKPSSFKRWHFDNCKNKGKTNDT